MYKSLHGIPFPVGGVQAGSREASQIENSTGTILLAGTTTPPHNEKCANLPYAEHTASQKYFIPWQVSFSLLTLDQKRQKQRPSSLP
jgi:hypothetical protein